MDILLDFNSKVNVLHFVLFFSSVFRLTKNIPFICMYVCMCVCMGVCIIDFQSEYQPASERALGIPGFSNRSGLCVSVVPHYGLHCIPVLRHFLCDDYHNCCRYLFCRYKTISV